MKIEVTSDNSTTVKVDSDFLALKHIPRLVDMLIKIAEGRMEPGEFNYAQDWFGGHCQVNVSVDGVKQATKEVIDRQAWITPATSTEDDARLGRMVRNMPEEAKLWRDLGGKWNMTGGEANAYLCTSAEDALKMGGVKP